METLLLIVIGVAAFWTAVGTIALYFFCRSIAVRQEGTMHEVEEIGAAQRRTIEKLHSMAHRLRVLAEQLPRDSRAGALSGEAEKTAEEVKAVKEDVLFLHRQGLDAVTIARELGIPSGEVELILDLERFGSRDK